MRRLAVCTVKNKVSDFLFPSRDVTNQSLPGREYSNLIFPGLVSVIPAGNRKISNLFYSVSAAPSKYFHIFTFLGLILLLFPYNECKSKMWSLDPASKCLTRAHNLLTHMDTGQDPEPSWSWLSCKYSHCTIYPTNVTHWQRQNSSVCVVLAAFRTCAFESKPPKCAFGKLRVQKRGRGLDRTKIRY